MSPQFVNNKSSFYCFQDNDKYYTQSDQNMRSDRKAYIGGSDAFAFGAGILGMPYKYTSPLVVWGTKNKHRVIKDNVFMKFGRDNEERIRNYATPYFQKFLKPGEVLEIRPTNQTFRLKQHVFVGGNIDGVCLITNQRGEIETAGLEVKTFSSTKGWEDGGIPINYWCQMQHYMLITGFRRFFLIGEQCIFHRMLNQIEKMDTPQIVVKEIKEDVEFQQLLLEQYILFWGEYMKEGNTTPPPPVGIPEETDLLPLLQSPHNTDQTLLAVLRAYEDCKAKMALLDGERERLKGVILDKVKDAPEYITSKKRSRILTCENFIIKAEYYLQEKIDKEKLRKLYPETYKECLVKDESGCYLRIKRGNEDV